MAPEHASGEAVDRRTDVYALGIILWEMLTMRPLFWSESDFGMLSQVRDPQVEAPSHFASRIGDALDRAVLRALSPAADGRPDSALSFRRILSGAVPFADALDEEQVSELLHVMLGDEFNRKRDQLPQIVALEVGDVPARDSMPEVLDTLTEPGHESVLFERSLADEPVTGSGENDITSDTGDDLDQVTTAESADDGPTELMDYEAINHLIDSERIRASAKMAKPEALKPPGPISSNPPTDPHGFELPASGVPDEFPRSPGLPSFDSDSISPTDDGPPSYLPALIAIGVVAFLIVVIALFTLV